MGGGRASGRAGGLVVLVCVWDGDSTGGGRRRGWTRGGEGGRAGWFRMRSSALRHESLG